MYSVRWENGYAGWVQCFFFFSFFGYQDFGKIWPKNRKIRHLKKQKNSKFSQFLCQKMAKFRQFKKNWMGASRTRQVSTRWTVKRVRNSGIVLKGALQFLGRADGGTKGGRCLSAGCSRAESQVFCLPRFVEDRGQICFSVCRAASFMCVC